MRTAVVAAAIAYTIDDQGILWLRAYDVSGFLICVCMVNEEQALKMSDFIDEAYEVMGDEIGEVVGHA